MGSMQVEGASFQKKTSAKPADKKKYKRNLSYVKKGKSLVQLEVEEKTRVQRNELYNIFPQITESKR